MKLDHPVIPLTGRLMITYIFATSRIAKVFFWSDNRAAYEHRALADDSRASGRRHGR